jgi:hypothetical protein
MHFIIFMHHNFYVIKGLGRVDKLVTKNLLY